MKRQETESIHNKNTQLSTTFRLSGRLFGVNITDVKEITMETSFTPIFHAPEEVRGYLNIRGHIHLVLDLNLLLGFGKTEVEADSRVVLFKPSVGESFGVLVDQIGDVVEVKENQIKKQSEEPVGKDINSFNHTKTKLTHGICQLDKELLVLLNSKKLLGALD